MPGKNIALLIIDMQNDFLHPDGFVPRYAQGIGVPDSAFALLRRPIPNMSRLRDSFHAAGLPVIYVYTAWNADHSDVAIPLRRVRREALHEGALVEGSWGAAIIAELAPAAGSHLVMKKSYGGFFQTPLDRLLRNLGSPALYLTGVATNFCVETTAREAVGYGYPVVLVSDATASYTAAGHEATLAVIREGFGDVLTTDEVVAEINRLHL